MSGSSRPGGNYGGLTAFDLILNKLIDKYEHEINQAKTPAEIRFLEHERNNKICEIVQTTKLKQLLTKR